MEINRRIVSIIFSHSYANLSHSIPSDGTRVVFASCDHNKVAHVTLRSGMWTFQALKDYIAISAPDYGQFHVRWEEPLHVQSEGTQGGPCSHQFVEMGFMHSKLVCKFCDQVKT